MVIPQVALGVIIVGLGLSGCGRQIDSTDETPSAPTFTASEKNVSERIRQIRDRVPEMPIIVLVKEPDPSSRILDIQDYVIDGENVLLMFSSKDALRQSLGGADLGRPTISISRPLLGEVLKGNEVFLFDPRLPTQIRFTAAEYREAFPEPFSPATTRGTD